MRLKKIELNGFKSFPDRTVIQLESGITALVGPNGCGKSNIIDAIRWCMGETNTRKLRAGLLEDLIFQSGNGRKPESMAEVVLYLSPENGGFPAAFSGEEELTVRRRIFRDGTSEYTLNGSACRLRDISEIFMDSGSGSRAYSLIEQGEVTNLIDARPEDRRVFIEQVAGIGKYRSRIQEATRRMEETRANLERVGDLLREIKRNMKLLEVQAGKAEEGRKIREELLGLGLSLDAETWRGLSARLQETETARATAEDEEARVAAELSGEEAAESELVQKLQKISETLEQARREEEETRNRIRARETEFSILTGQDENLDREILHCREEIAAWQGKQAELERELEEKRRAREELERELSRRSEELARNEARQAEQREKLRELERLREERKTLLSELIREEALLSHKEDQVAERIRLAGEQREKSERERQEVLTGQGMLEARRVQFQQLELALKAEEVRLEQNREQLLSEREVNAREQQRWREEISRAEEEMISLRATLEVLREEGDLPDSAGSAAGPGVPRLEEVLEVETGAEMAVEACLAERLSGRLVPDLEAGISAAQGLAAEAAPRQIFLPRNPRPGPSGAAHECPAPAVPLLSKVRFPEEYRPLAELLFREVFLVPSLADAPAVFSGNGHSLVLVTPGGEMALGSGEVRGGRMKAEESRLIRLRKVRELTQNLEGVEGRLSVFRSRLAGIGQKGGELGQELERLTATLQEKRVNFARRENEEDLLRAEFSRLERRREFLELELSGLEREISALHSEGEGIRGRREEMARQKAGGEEDLARGEEELKRVRRECEERDTELSGQRISAAALQERLAGWENVVNRMTAEVRELLAEAESRRQAILAAEEQVGKNRARREEIQGELGTLFQGREEIQKLIQEQGKCYQEETAGLRKRQEKIRTLRHDRDRAQTKLQEFRGVESGLRVELEGVTTRIRERYDREPAPDLSTPFDGQERGERERRKAELKQKLDDLGEINPGALKLFEEEKERFEFLNRQREDLLGSLSRLSRAIVRMDKTSRERLLQAYTEVNRSFKEVFPRLFDGGEGELVWVGEDPLEAGVEIIAHPLGKRPRSLSLLSGGEKALASVAFLIACFLAHPSPFCILDEVDAPLDEANISRFNNLVRELAGQSQFILITHNRRTMEMADVLYGVTMEEPGISKLISVKLN
ncbi:MAG: chromosome segregation protein SMC [Proteobacteria bacterium]|nr:chromosome segregation protein SMC [Pseudomonadota bacterium]